MADRALRGMRLGTQSMETAAHAEHKSAVARLAQRRRSLERERRGREIMAQVPEIRRG